MRLVDLLNKANEGYCDGYLLTYFDTETGELIEGDGDTLAEFIVIELSETFDPDADDEQQLHNAIQAMASAKQDIAGVIESLFNHMKQEEK